MSPHIEFEEMSAPVFAPPRALGPVLFSTYVSKTLWVPMDQRSIEEHVARDLLAYFTGQHPTGVKYDDQPHEVRELWLGAARVAISAIKAFQT